MSPSIAPRREGIDPGLRARSVPEHTRIGAGWHRSQNGGRRPEGQFSGISHRPCCHVVLRALGSDFYSGWDVHTRDGVGAIFSSVVRGAGSLEAVQCDVASISMPVVLATLRRLFWS